MTARPRIVQAGAPLDLRGTAGAPFSLSVAVDVEPDTVVLSGWAVEAQVVPSVEVVAGRVVVSWSAEQTAQMTGAKPWALTVDVDGDGPHPVLAGSVWMAPITRPGDATTVEHDVSVLVGSTVELDLAVTVGGTSGIVVEVVAGDGVTVDASDPARPVVGVTPGAFVAGDDPRLSDARTPTSHGNEAHTASYVDAAGAAAAAPVQSVQGQTGAVTLSAGDVGAATSTQGGLADTAVQPGDLAAVATSGDYGDLSGTPTLGGASALDVGTGAGTVAAGDDSRIVGAIPASTLTTDGDILTRTSGVPARISRDDLAADAAFSGRYAPHLPGPSPLGEWFSGAHQLIGTAAAHNRFRYFYYPVQLPPGTYDQMGINITTSGSGHAIRLAVFEFDSVSNLPGDRLAQTGEIDASSAGALSDDLDTPLVWPGGWLFLGFAGNANEIGFTAVGGQTLGMPSTLGTTGGACCYRQTKGGSAINMPTTANPTEILETTGTTQPLVKIHADPS